MECATLKQGSNGFLPDETKNGVSVGLGCGCLEHNLPPTIIATTEELQNDCLGRDVFLSMCAWTQHRIVS